MSRAQNTRTELLAAVEQAVREFSTLSVLFSLKVGERLGMNPTDMECLDLLNVMGPLSAGRLATLTSLTTGAVTAMIDRLEQAGYVQRERDAHDRRRVIVRRVEERVEQEIAPAFAGKRQAWIALCSRYSEAELAIILDFVNGCKQMNRDELTSLRAARSSSQQRSR
jgi:DNA-binding MarR family transcriptional regulator